MICVPGVPPERAKQTTFEMGSQALDLEEPRPLRHEAALSLLLLRLLGRIISPSEKGNSPTAALPHKSDVKMNKHDSAQAPWFYT